MAIVDSKHFDSSNGSNTRSCDHAGRSANWRELYPSNRGDSKVVDTKHRHTYRHPHYFGGEQSIETSSNHSIASKSSSSSSSISHGEMHHSRCRPPSNKKQTSLQQGESKTGESPSFSHSYKKPTMPSRTSYIAMDCEMVGSIAVDGSCSSLLARVVLIDWKGRTILDTFVKPSVPVDDYRTFVSGITEAHLQDAPDFLSVRDHVRALISEKILVGHGLENDLAVLKLDHPWWMIRDTAYYQPFMREVASPLTETSAHIPSKLKDLCRKKLGREIQLEGHAHCPAEDALAALDLYKSHRPRWETCLTTHIQQVEKQRHQHQHQQPIYHQQQHYYDLKFDPALAGY